MKHKNKGMCLFAVVVAENERGEKEGNKMCV